MSERQIQIIGLKDFKEKAKAGEATDSLVCKSFNLAEKKVNKDRRTVQGIISTPGIDRDYDVIEPMGLDFSAYMKNPVVLYGHNYGSLPVAKALTITPTPSGVDSIAQFPDVEVCGFADTVFKMLDGGFLNAFSIGFRPKKYEIVEDESRPWGLDIKEAEVYEYSVVPVPANPEALVAARKSGIDVVNLKDVYESILDGEESPAAYVVEASHMQAVYKALKEAEGKGITIPVIGGKSPDTDAPRDANPGQGELATLKTAISGLEQQVKELTDRIKPEEKSPNSIVIMHNEPEEVPGQKELPLTTEEISAVVSKTVEGAINRARGKLD